MDPGLERLFQLREEFQMEVEKDLKAQLLKGLMKEVKPFLVQHNLRMTEWDFLHATSDAYKNWRRNKH